MANAQLGTFPTSPRGVPNPVASSAAAQGAAHTANDKLLQTIDNAVTYRDHRENQAKFQDAFKTNLSRNILAFTDNPEMGGSAIVNPRNRQLASSRANADLRQGLGAPSLETVLRPDSTADEAQASLASRTQALSAADSATKKDIFNLEAIGQGAAADQRSFGNQLGRIQNSSEISKANSKFEADQAVKQARSQAIGQIAGAFMAKGLDNIDAGKTIWGGAKKPGTQ